MWGRIKQVEGLVWYRVTRKIRTKTGKNIALHLSYILKKPRIPTSLRLKMVVFEIIFFLAQQHLPIEGNGVVVATADF